MITTIDVYMISPPFVDEVSMVPIVLGQPGVGAYGYVPGGGNRLMGNRASPRERVVSHDPFWKAKVNPWRGKRTVRVPTAVTRGSEKGKAGKRRQPHDGKQSRERQQSGNSVLVISQTGGGAIVAVPAAFI